MIYVIVIVLTVIEICDDDVIHFLYTGIYGKKINQLIKAELTTKPLIRGSHDAKYQRPRVH
jgi:hypothetical protein